MKKVSLFAALYVVAASSIVSAAPLDHFKCYPADARQTIDESVLLRDQFGEEKARVLQAVRFCNPAKKVHGETATEIKNPDAHLEFYRIATRTDTPPRTVAVSNQFGRERKLEVGQPVFLAVPTHKLEPGRHHPPKDLDHLKCYKAFGEPIDQRVTLRDQFGSEHRLKVREPVVLCNPTEKTHRNEVTRINNPAEHLVCYGLENTHRATRVRARNQFGEDTLALEPADMLCVPSHKREIGEGRLPGEVGDRQERADLLEDAPPPFQTCQLSTPDFVVTGSETTVWGDDHCFPSDGNGNFGPRADIPDLTIVDGMDVADMDGDGDNDFLACDGIQGEVYLYTQGPPGIFTPSVVATGVTSGSGGSLFCTYLREGDFNEDGWRDFVVGDNRVTKGMFVYLQGPPGSFTPVSALDVSWASPSGAQCNCLFGLAAGDVDGDSHDDVLVLEYRGAGAGQVRFYRGDGTGAIDPPILEFNISADFPIVSAPTGIALFDYEGDGDLDIAAGGSADGSHYIYSNDGIGNFTPLPGPAFDVDSYSGIDGFDANGDNKDDLVLVDWWNRNLLYVKNLGGNLDTPTLEGTVDGNSIGIGAPRLAPRPQTGLDHFKCYRTESVQPADAEVLLSDQFGSEEAIVLEPSRFCNPVEKRHDDHLTPIQNRDAHLEFYRIETETETQPRQVRVSNQFGKEKSIEVRRLVFLAVPTQKIEPGGHPFPKNLDHFKCYEARGEPVSGALALRDQFGLEPEVKVHRPALLCNPAEKIHDDKETPVENPEGHLMCYELEGTQLTAGAQTRNQFGEETHELHPADLLCVPSRKRESFQDPNITQLCGDNHAVNFDGGMVVPNGPGTGLLRENPSAAWPDGRPRRPCGAFVPIHGFIPSGGVKRFRVAYRKHTDPVPPVGTAPGIHTKWILSDRQVSFPNCDVNPLHILETTGSLNWMNAPLYKEAQPGGFSTDWCPNPGVRLSVWDSANALDPNGHYVVWLEWEDTGNVLHKEPLEHHLQLDNELPDLNDLKVTLSNGTTPVAACGEAPEGEDTFKIFADFDDDFYWSYRVIVSGGSPPISIAYPKAAEDPDGNDWHDYYEGTPQVVNTDKTGTMPNSTTVFLRDIDMNDFAASFTDCCYLLRLRVRDAAIRHKFDHRVANDNTPSYWTSISQFITFGAAP